MGANLTKAHLKNTDLTGANLEGAFLVDADIKGANLESTCLDESYQFDTNFTSSLK